ncbi:MAG: phosphomethylpyrimidine synthase ThiC [Armatimonadetes bacterium]|nr:phosphomethylpyrimidine synthase ThiC [Armatimonadota bacterium]MDW8154272.1 phosphomethylpyrimidine synthase ThiC [Armatimonadota bacterium]
MATQMELARRGKITDAMAYVAEVEGVSPEEIREKVAAGVVVIPANPHHGTLTRYTGIGKDLSVKVNANLGTSYDSVDLEEELEKLRLALTAGADTIMDLSTGGDLPAIRRAVLERCPVPLGTVPIYEAEFEAARKRGSFFHMTVDDLFATVERHGREGVDFITVHCGVTRHALEHYLRTERVTGIVSRGGGLLAAWMLHNHAENPLYQEFDRLLEIAREYDMTLSLGDGLRPGCLADDLDRPQVEELVVLGELVERARRAGVQTMVEGPGHVPLNEIATNVQLEKKLCREAPFYVLGMLPVDTAAGFDHIAGAIGGAVAGMYGVDMLCYLTPAEHLALPTPQQVYEGVVAFKIAAHAADVARGNRRALERNRRMSEARYRLDWETQFQLALYPEVARGIFEARKSATRSCSMCGPFCPMNLVEHMARRVRSTEPSTVGSP